jgi:hypothetical protein
VYWVGKKYPKLQPWALAFMISFLPLSMARLGPRLAPLGPGC